MSGQHHGAVPRDLGHGRTQAERGADALDPGSAPVDERAPAYFLAFAGEYARLLNFYELTGEISGDWRPFFDADISFLLADISTVRDQDELHASGALLRHWQWQAPAGEAAQEVIGHAYAMLHRTDGWLARAQRLDDVALDPAAGAALHEQTTLTLYLEALIRDHLRPHLDSILGHHAWRACWHEAERRAGAAGRGPAAGAGLPWYQRAPWTTVPGDAAPAERHVDLPRILQEIAVANSQLKAVAADSLERSLAAGAAHPPHTALYIAFVQLLQALRTDLNRFTERHLDYYYREILQLRERVGTPDHGHAAFQLAPAFSSYLLPRGSQLGAGKDADGNAVLYATDSDILLNQGSVASLRTQYVVRDPDTGWVRHAFAAPVANSADGLGQPLANPELGWQTFGYLGEQQFSSAAQLQARFGLLIAAPVLQMAEGRRRVSLRFGFHSASVAAVGGALERQRAANPGAAPANWCKLVRDSLTVSLSGAKDWIGVPRFCLRSAKAQDAGTACIELVFAIGADQAAIVPNPKLGGAIDSTAPMLRIALRPDASVYLYSALAGLVLEQVDIQVEVRGLANVRVSAPGAPGKPFAPFGNGMPGAAVDIVHAEFAKPQLQWVGAELDWTNLPATPADFAQHYDGYGNGFDAAGFALRVFQARAQRWVPVLPGADVPLIGATPSRTRLGFTVPPAATGDPVQGAVAPGTVRIALVAPPDGFGLLVYPRAFADQALRNAAHLIAKDPPADLEPSLKPPLVPTVQALRCAYGAAERISLIGPAAAPKLFALHPFGASALRQDSRAPVFDDDGFDGRLYIGLAGLRPPQSISLHFQVREKMAALYTLGDQDADAVAPLSWRYLAADAWCDFAPHQVRSDTAGLTRSGIVTFQLPRELNDDNSAMPGGLFWLEARAKGLAVRHLTIDILPQVVAVTRCAGAATAAAPPHTIQGMLKKIPQIAAVLQPHPTRGGSANENAAQFRVRVSERLKHRQRASQPGDFERLVLADFPGIRQAKCITANNSRAYPAEGRVGAGELVVALVQQGAPGAMPAPAPLWLLAAIARQLQRCSASMVRNISVRNCAYEEIKVFANIEFKPGFDERAALTHLDQAISRFVAPWLDDAALALPMGCGEIDGRQIADLIRRQPYVSRSSAIGISHLCTTADGDSVTWIDESGVARLSTPWSVFVPARRHGIQSGSADANPSTGIGSLTVNADLTPAGHAAPAGRHAADAAPDRYFLAFPALPIETNPSGGPA